MIRKEFFCRLTKEKTDKRQTFVGTILYVIISSTRVLTIEIVILNLPITME